MTNYIPQYSTPIFTDIWDDVDDFKADFADSPFNGCIKTNPDNVSIVFYLLYARYGNSPINLTDEMQWKQRVFSIIYQYGPTWERRVEIQKTLRELTETELLKGSTAVYNHANNPSTDPAMDAFDPLNYINEQNASGHKKSKMDAYTQLWDLLATDVTEEFIRRFKKCFKTVISPEQPVLFITDDEEGE